MVFNARAAGHRTIPENSVSFKPGMFLPIGERQGDPAPRVAGIPRRIQAVIAVQSIVGRKARDLINCIEPGPTQQSAIF